MPDVLVLLVNLSQKGAHPILVVELVLLVTLFHLGEALVKPQLGLGKRICVLKQHPEPGVVIDDLCRFINVSDALLEVAGVVVVIPLVEVNECLGELLTLRRLLVNEVDSANASDLQVFKDSRHLRCVTPVGKHARDVDGELGVERHDCYEFVILVVCSIENLEKMRFNFFLNWGEIGLF